MKLDINSTLYILIYITLLLSIIGCLTYFYKEILYHKIKYIFIKNIFLNRFEYLERLLPKQYFVFQKYDIWRYCSLF